MSFRRVGAILAVAGLLVVAACAGGRSGVVYNSSFLVGYDPYSTYAAMSRAPLLVETFGAPADGPAAGEVSRATVLALRQHGPSWLPRNYTASPAEAGNGSYRLRIAYGLPRAFDRQQVCRATMDTAAIEAARRPADAGSTRTVASFCRGETTLGIAEGSPGAGPEVTAERFSRFVGAMGRAVMPRRNPVMDHDCMFRPCE